jgi:site-specific recombinase XerD
MTQFRSVFKHELAEYLEISQGTVSDDTLRSTRRTLLSFDSLLVAENADRVTETAINHWIRELQQINAPKTVSDKVSYLRKFLRYLQYKGYSVFMPACPKTSDSYVPYIFSDREIQTLLSCADSWANRHTDPKTRRTDMEFCMLLRMLLGCGFRLGEPLAARVKDINFRNGTILIRHAKNNKQRVVPMDRTLTEMLERYCIAMGIKTEPESCLFPAVKEPLIFGLGTSCGKPACMYRKNPIPEGSAFIASVTILPSIHLRRQRKTDARQMTLFLSCQSILGTMTWTKRRNI